MITINDILDGAKKVEKVYLNSMDDYIFLRPLTQSEIASIEEIEASALGTFTTEEKSFRGRQQKGEARSTAQINIVKQTQATNNSKIRAVALACSVNDEEYKDKQIAELPSDVFKEIYDHVRTMNNLGQDVNIEQELEQFPENE